MTGKVLRDGFGWRRVRIYDVDIPRSLKAHRRTFVVFLAICHHNPHLCIRGRNTGNICLLQIMLRQSNFLNQPALNELSTQ